MKITAEPRSDQWNADDFVGSSKTFTIAGVKVGSAEQKYDIALEGESRVWRPPLTILRILMDEKVWGDESDVWIGRRVTLYRDPTVRFGKDVVGGIRLSHVSHIAKPVTLAVTTTRGKRAMVTIEPLVERAQQPLSRAQAAPEPTPDDIAASTSIPDLRAMWQTASPERQALIAARVDELKAGA
jgi:hypothetical protein